jgi:ABC-type spermidine/putrescine transport system permease subunit I
MPFRLGWQLSYRVKNHDKQRMAGAAIIPALTRNSVLNQSFLLLWLTQLQSLQTKTTFSSLQSPQLCTHLWLPSMVLPIAVELKLTPR